MDHFIVDTNVFISMNEFNEQVWLGKLSAIKAENKDITLNVTGQIVGEMPFLRGERRKQFEGTVKIHAVKQSDIDALKVAMNEKNPAQDPDLSLLYIADQMANAKGGSTGTWLVSDDFKLVENVERYNSKIKTLTPGSFLLKLSTLTSDAKLRRYFKAMEKKVTDYSIKYILSRQDVYPAAKKLSWLVDKTASLIGGGDADGLEESELVNEIVAKKTSFISSSTLNEDEIATIRIADIYLSGAMPLSADQARRLEHIADYLDGLKSTTAWITSAKKAILEEKVDDALRILGTLESDVMNALVKARFEYKDGEFNIIHVVSAIQAYKVTFFKAYVNLLKGNILNALTHLTETGYWAMQSHQDEALLNAVYIKAMIFLSSFSDLPDFYIKAIENYEYARFLAEKIGNDQIQLKCLLAKAIASFQVERADDARVYIQEVQRLSAKRPDVAASAFSEMADFFLTFGKPEYSVFLYDEALEAAVVANIEHKNRALLDKIKKSYIIAGTRMGEIVKGGVHLDSLLDESFNIMKKEDVDRYNEEIMKLAQFNSLMYEPFPITYKNWTGYVATDNALKQEFDIVEIEDAGGRARVIVYSSSLGLIAFVVPGTIAVAGPPEAYFVTLAKTANIKISQVKGDLFNEKLIRALVYVKDPSDIEIRRHIPAFLKIAG